MQRLKEAGIRTRHVPCVGGCLLCLDLTSAPSFCAIHLPASPHFVGGAHMTTPYSPRAVSPMTVDRPVGRQAWRSPPDHFGRITRHVRDIDASRVRHSIGFAASDRCGRATRQVLEHKNNSGSHRLRQDRTPCSSVLNLCSRCLSLGTHASPPKAIIFHGLRPTKKICLRLRTSGGLYGLSHRMGHVPLRDAGPHALDAPYATDEVDRRR